MRGINDADIQRGVEEVIKQFEETNFDDLLTLLMNRPLKPLGPGAWLFGRFFITSRISSAKVFLQVFHFVTLQGTL